MKKYPTIPKIGQLLLNHRPMYAFDKIDGSNIRAEWSKKRGFYKFGKRHGLLADTDPILGESKELILSTYEDDLIKIFEKQRWNNVTCFFEFAGPNSFAGSHEKEPHEVTLIDVAADKRGILEPDIFLKLFDNLKIAAMLYYGYLDYCFILKVQEGRLPGMTFEGVVCKGKAITPGCPVMIKIKNLAWINKLSAKYRNQPEMIEKLL